MAKKIYDIKPPKLARKAEKELKEFFDDKPAIRQTSKKTHGRHKKERHFSWKTVWAVSGLVGLLALAYLFFKLPKANIEIWPEVSVLSFQSTVTADKTVDSVDSVDNIIPAQYLEEEKTVSQDFPATGNASNEGQATGTITVYNKYDPPAPITLKAGTHFLSDSGKYFVTLQKIVIPAAKKSGSKITPGSVDVKVKAVEGGEGYNIGAATFSVPKLSGTAYYYSVYAQSTSAMTGGYSGDVKKVTDDDIQSAKDATTKKATSEAEDSLRNKVATDYVLLNNAISSNVVTAETKTKSGTVAENFSYQATVKSRALVFKKSDLDSFVKEYIFSQIQSSEAILEKSLDVKYDVKSLNIEDGKIILDLTFSAGTYSSIDKNSLLPLLINKNSSQISQTILDNLGEDKISNVKVKLWPFWVTKAPKTQKAVKIDLKFE